MELKIKKWTPLVCEWEDATSTSQGLNSKDFVTSYNPMIRRTVGFFLHKNDHGIFICETDDRLGIFSQDCENVTVIPLGMIRRIEVLSTLQSIPGTPQSAALNKL